MRAYVCILVCVLVLISFDVCKITRIEEGGAAIPLPTQLTLDERKQKYSANQKPAYYKIVFQTRIFVLYP